MRALVAGALLLLAACGSTPPTATPRDPESAPAPYAALIERVAAVRGLAPKTPIVVRELDARGYEDAQRKHDPNASVAVSKAFLDPRTSIIYAHGANDEQITELVVNALLNQHFAYDERLRGLGKTDAADALEGLAIADASLVRLLKSDPSRPELTRHVARLSAMSPEKAVADGRFDAALLKEPPFAIRKVMMMQVRSLALVTRLYLAGGWPLVDRAWKNPPTQIEHLADPKAYVDGSRNPAALPAIPATPGMSTVEEVNGMSAVEVYGFFDSFLTTATGDHDSLAATLLSGAQRGMSARIVDRPGYGRAFVVVSAWESPRAAQRFAERWLEAKTTVTDCGPIAKVRDHAVVATLCVGAAASEKLIEETLSKVGPLPPPAPPLGPVTLPVLDEK